MREVRLMRGYDAVAVSRASAVDTGPETLVQQHLRDEVDVNTIVRRFGMTGAMPAGVPGGMFGDFTGVSDFESAVAAVTRAEEGFMTLPAAVRERFGNNPGMLIEYAQGVPIEQLDAEVRGLAAPAPQPVVVAAAAAPAPVGSPAAPAA